MKPSRNSVIQGREQVIVENGNKHAQDIHKQIASLLHICRNMAPVDKQSSVGSFIFGMPGVLENLFLDHPDFRNKPLISSQRLHCTKSSLCSARRFLLSRLQD